MSATPAPHSEIPTREGANIYEGDETFTVTLTNPSNATIAKATAKGTILETNQLPKLNFDISDHIRHETNGTNHFMDVSITPWAENSFDFTLHISGSARNGDDYVGVASTHTVQPNQQTYSIQINVIDDNVYEGVQEQALFRVQVNPTVGRIGEDDTSP